MSCGWELHDIWKPLRPEYFINICNFFVKRRKNNKIVTPKFEYPFPHSFRLLAARSLPQPRAFVSPEPGRSKVHSAHDLSCLADSATYSCRCISFKIALFYIFWRCSYVNFLFFSGSRCFSLQKWPTRATIARYLWVFHLLMTSICYERCIWQFAAVFFQIFQFLYFL